MERDVAPDGSPIPVYMALPLEPEFTPVLEFLSDPGSVLDLGCGVGRLANVLARAGFEVTGVDESAEMLARVDPDVLTICADIRRLALDGREFETVVLASHLVNVADGAMRRDFLRAAADHLAPNGAVLIQHWEMPPVTPQDTEAQVADVLISFKVLALNGKDLHARVTYAKDGRCWEQLFSSHLLDEDDLARELDAAGLRLAENLSPKWSVARLA